MSIPVVAFFNNKGGVGKTSLVYHVSWMMAEFGLRVLAADLDPQGNLSAAFLDEERLEGLWPDGEEHPSTIFGAVQPILDGIGDISVPSPTSIDSGLTLLPGDMDLSRFEDELSQVWPKCLDEDRRAFRVTSAFWRVLQAAAASDSSNVILVDLGPNLGAINRAALIASDFLVLPLGPDLFSLQGLRNFGPKLRAWRKEWKDRMERNPDPNLGLPQGKMEPIGYVVMQHSVRLDRPVYAYDRWIGRIPNYYRRYVLNKSDAGTVSVAEDEHCIALIRHYRSLVPMAQEARKPVFHLKPADGARGSHLARAQDAFKEFKHLAIGIAERAGVSLPSQ